MPDSSTEADEILNTEMEDIPAREMWLYQNPEALALFIQGLAEAAAGEVIGHESFSQYANDELEDE